MTTNKEDVLIIAALNLLILAAFCAAMVHLRNQALRSIEAAAVPTVEQRKELRARRIQESLWQELDNLHKYGERNP